MRDPRNEREAYPHLQRQADLKYRRYEMHKVQPVYRTRPRRWVWVLLAAFAVGLAGTGVGVYQLLRNIL